MYAVIFKAEIKELDEEYNSTAKNMRELAINKYGCTEFISTTEENIEIAISYWETQEQIKKWKNDEEHIKAQNLGKERWYKSYTVQVVEIVREYNEIT